MAKQLTNAKGQYWAMYTADQQLYKVACQIIWNDPDQFTPFIPRLGGMHFLMSFIGTVGANAANSGLDEVLGAAFSGVSKMLSGKKFPQNFRALRILTEELLRDILQSKPEIQSHNLQREGVFARIIQQFRCIFPLDPVISLYLLFK